MKLRTEEITSILKSRIEQYDVETDLSEVGTVLQVGDGIARVHGLENCVSLERLEFEHGVVGIAFNLEEDNVGVALFGQWPACQGGTPVRRTGCPSLTSCHCPKSATPTLSSSRLNAMPTTPCSNSSLSARRSSRPWTRAAVSDLQHRADLGEVRAQQVGDGIARVHGLENCVSLERLKNSSTVSSASRSISKRTTSAWRSSRLTACPD